MALPLRSQKQEEARQAVWEGLARALCVRVNTASCMMYARADIAQPGGRIYGTAYMGALPGNAAIRLARLLHRHHRKRTCSSTQLKNGSSAAHARPSPGGAPPTPGPVLAAASASPAAASWPSAAIALASSCVAAAGHDSSAATKGWDDQRGPEG